MDTRTMGRLGEDFAAQVLAAEGFTILARNYRCSFGEIDLIARRENELYFIEVKTRRSDRFGRPSEAVNLHKQSRIKKAASYYLRELDRDNPIEAEVKDLCFSVIEIRYHSVLRAF